MDALMKKLGTLFNKLYGSPLGMGVAGLIVGLIIGLPIFGWGLTPVRYEGAGPAKLYEDFKLDYMQMAIDSYALNNDAIAAQRRYKDLGKDADQLWEKINQTTSPDKQPAVSKFGSVVSLASAPTTPGTIQGTPAKPPTGQTPTVTQLTLQGTPVVQPTMTSEKPQSGLGGVLRSFLIIVLLLAVVVGLAFWVRSRRQPPAQPGSKSTPSQPPAEDEVETAQSEQPQEAPMAQYMASYKVGDDLFDDSYSIDSPTGEFLGECGVEISETIGVGDPKKVTAFEVWLFDKNDIQTVTQVLMSEHAFKDNTTRVRLSAKGEPVPVSPGGWTELETQSLRLVVRVVDMAYGEGALPANSFFDHFILQLDVYKKA